MKILEIITVPFFTPRGTSFSALERTKAMSRMGHHVEILTYAIGKDVEIPNVTIHRIPNIPGIRTIPMGPSLRKLVLDFFLAGKTLRFLLCGGPWDLVHVHEEAAFWVAGVKPIVKCPLLYDMHSSLVEQVSNFGFGKWPLVRRAFALLERMAIRRADGVIVICPRLVEVVRKVDPEVPLQAIENLPVGWEDPRPSDEDIKKVAQDLGVGGARVILYTGSFGVNQGLELAIEAMVRVIGKYPEVRLVLVGGASSDLGRVRSYARRRRIDRAVVLRGPENPEKMSAYMAVADVLLSPRTEGTNTPLKIYSYLAAGKPIVATNLPTHTQVLSCEVAMLVEATPDGLADGVLSMLDDPAEAARLGAAAKQVADERYGFDRYFDQLTKLMECLESERGM